MLGTSVIATAAAGNVVFEPLTSSIASPMASVARLNTVWLGPLPSVTAAPPAATVFPSMTNAGATPGANDAATGMSVAVDALLPLPTAMGMGTANGRSAMPGKTTPPSPPEVIGKAAGGAAPGSPAPTGPGPAGASRRTGAWFGAAAYTAPPRLVIATGVSLTVITWPGVAV